MVAPDCFLNCKAIPPTVETAVTFVNVGLLLSLSPSKAVEKSSILCSINVFSTTPFHPSDQSTESSSLFSKYRFLTPTEPPKNSTPSSAPLITAIFSKIVSEPTA